MKKPVIYLSFVSADLTRVEVPEGSRDLAGLRADPDYTRDGSRAALPWGGYTRLAHGEADLRRAFAQACKERMGF